MAPFIYKEAFVDHFKDLNPNVWQCDNQNCKVSNNEFIIENERPWFKQFSLHTFPQFDIEFEIFHPTSDRIAFGLQSKDAVDVFYFFQDVSTTRISLWENAEYRDLNINVFTECNVWHKARISSSNNQYYAYFDETAWFAPRSESFPIYFSFCKWNNMFIKIRNFKITAAFQVQKKSSFSFLFLTHILHVVFI